jgi:hypothetical protein
MATVQVRDVPQHTLLSPYGAAPGYADCYVVEVPGRVSQQAFIAAFYTSPLFKVERTLLRYLASRPATDGDARQLAAGRAQVFSAWRVEAQSDSELLLADVTGRTRSWLMATPAMDNSGTTLLHFGSAVVARAGRDGKRPHLGRAFRALLGFHRVYSQLLLSAACKRVGRT